MINGFSELAMRALGEDGNEYYVYALIDPRDDKVFYIGKGTKNRVFSHEKESDKAQDVETRKVEIIKEIEKEISALEAENDSLTEEISQPKIAKNFPLLSEKCARIDEIKTRLDDLYDEYATLID